jgi:arsenite oxidase small subunit
MRDEPETRNVEDSDAGAARLSRRAFCRRAALSASAIAAAPVPAAGQQDARRKIEGAELLMLGYAMTFRYPTERDLAILVRTRDGRYHAYTQNCTHQGCPVNFERAHDRLECPCHQGAYDLQTGASLFGPPRLPLTRIDLELRPGGEVWAVGKV